MKSLPGKTDGISRFAITLIISIVLAALVCYLRIGTLEEETGIARPLLQAASDGCFVVGLMLACAGIIVFASNDGFFLIFGYGISCLFSVFYRRDEDVRRKQSFAEYKLEKCEKQGRFWYLLINALLFIIAAFITAKMC